MKIAICYDLPKDRKNNDVQMDRQINFLMKNLTKLGHEPIAAGFTGSPEKYTQTIQKIKPNLLWNLFESFNGSRPLAYLGVMLLDDIGTAYTGNSIQAVLFNTDLSVSKFMMVEAKIPILPYYRLGDTAPAAIGGRWHLSPLHGKGEDSVVTVATLEDLQREIILHSIQEEHYAERQIQGRSFYVAMLSTIKGMVPVGIVEDKNPTLSFDYGLSPAVLSDMKTKTMSCANVFGLSGFTLIKFAVSDKGSIYVTGVETKPILSEDSPFCRICERAGISNTDVLQVLIAVAQKK